METYRIESLTFTYPGCVGEQPAAASPISLFAAYLALGASPLILNIYEDRKWKLIASKA